MAQDPKDPTPAAAPIVAPPPDKKPAPGSLAEAQAGWAKLAAALEKDLAGLTEASEAVQQVRGLIDAALHHLRLAIERS